MATPGKQTQDVPQKPESIFASINRRSFRSIADKPFQLFRTWFLVVYHPRDFFSYFFGSSTHLTVDSTILLGMLKYDIDTKEKRILDPLRFLIESVAVVLVANAVTIHLILNMRIHGERLSAELPKLTELGFVNDAVFSLCFVALIAICSVLESLYVFLVCKKATMKKMIDLYVYINTSQFLAQSVGGVVAVFSLTTIFNNFPAIGTNNQGGVGLALSRHAARLQGNATTLSGIMTT